LAIYDNLHIDMSVLMMMMQK